MHDVIHRSKWRPPAPLPGYVAQAWKRGNDGKVRGPYWYRRWSVGGKEYREYLRPRRVPYVRRQCAAWRALQAEIRAHRKQARDDLRTMSAFLREVERWTRP